MLEVVSNGLAWFAALPARVLLVGVRAYQKLVSPVLPAVFGPTFGCRFYPSCSHYAAEALRERGAVVGLALTGWRLLRCTPLSAGGFDPVPRRQVRTCARVPRPEVRGLGGRIELPRDPSGGRVMQAIACKQAPTGA